ncbi:hypothetical protein P7C73_g3490, partial [Tremellales sp. Uapishka_1]
MPHLSLKSLFKGPRPRPGASQLSQEVTEYQASTHPPATDRSTLGDIAATLENEVAAGGSGDGKEDTGTMARLLEVLQEIQGKKAAEIRGTPRDEAWEDVIGAVEAAQNATESPLLGVLGLGKCTEVLNGCAGILESQQREMRDMRLYIQGKKLPTLRTSCLAISLFVAECKGSTETLGAIYSRVEQSLLEQEDKSEEAAYSALSTILKVLQEGRPIPISSRGRADGMSGPDYLINVILVEAIIWQAEVIDPSFGAEIRQVLDKVVAEQPEPITFRRAAESILAISCALPRTVLDDVEGQDAYKCIGTLLKQLQVRVEPRDGAKEPSQPSMAGSMPKKSSSFLFTPGEGEIPLPGSRRRTPSPSPGASPAASATSLTPLPSDPNYTHYASASSLEQSYSTGQKGLSSLPLSGNVTPSLPPSGSATPSRQPVSPISESSEDEELWEYRGQTLTRSALSLVIRQENLAMADSSGQYTGQVSWDEIRNAWIPNWAEKLQAKDVMEGEIPSTNPADFKVKKKDPWQNKIGWYQGKMYYEEDPSFELRE